MRQTLFYIPTEIFGVPVFGIGILFWLILLYFVWRTLRGLFRRQTGDLVSDLAVGAIALVIVAWVAPALNHGYGLPVRGYGVFLMLGIVVASLFAIVRAKKKWNIPPELILSIVVVEVVSGIVGARLFYVAEYWRTFIVRGAGGIDLGATLRSVINLTQGGLVVFGSIIGGILTTLIYLRLKKLPLLATMDIFSPALMIGIAIGRLGCFMNGCCFGGVCDAVPPGVVFPVASPSHYYQMEHGLASLGGFNLFIPNEDSAAGDETLFRLKKKNEGLMASFPDEPIVVESVDAGSAPEQAGLKPGMTILRAGVLLPVKEPPTPQEINRAQMYALLGTHGFMSFLYDNGFPVRFPYLVLDVLDPPNASGAAESAADENAEPATSEKESGETGAVESVPPKSHRLAFHPGPFEVRAVHPTQLYSSALALLLAVILCIASRHVQKDGFVFALMLICYPVCRFLIELVRTDEPSFMGTGLSVSQCVSLLVFLIGLALMVYALTRHGAPAFEGRFPPDQDEAGT